MEFLDAVTIPYQVVLRNENGAYINQYPQSFYVAKGAACFIAAGVGGGSHFLKKDFSEIDFSLCLPEPIDYDTSTNEGRMAYLSTMFTGQQGTLIPTNSTSMTAIVSNISELDLELTGTYTSNLVSVATIAKTQEHYVGSIGEGIIKKWYITVSFSESNQDIDANLFKIVNGSKTIIAFISITAGVVGVFEALDINASFTKDELMGIEYVVPPGSGEVTISNSTLFVEYQ